MKDISIVTVNWNSWEEAIRCVCSVRRTVRKVSCEILLVDNASARDRSEEFQRECGEIPLTLLRNSANLGFARGCNQGIQKASGRHLLLLNPDVEVKEGAIDASVEFMDRRPEVGVLGCRLLNGDGSLQRWTGGRLPTLGAAFSHYFFLSAVLPGTGIYLSRDDDRPHEVDWVCGAYLLARREAVDQVGRLNEDFFLYAEDMEWCERIRKKGWKVIYFPQAAVVHFSGRSIAQVPRERYWRGLYSMSRFFALRGHGRISRFFFDLTVAGGFLLRVVLYGLASWIRPCGQASGKAASSWGFFRAAVRVLLDRPPAAVVPREGL